MCPFVAIDKAATEKFLAVYNGWQVSTPIFVRVTYAHFDCTLYRFAEPLVTGDYPALCKEVHGSRLPAFTDDQKALVKGSSDFLA